MKEGIEGRNEGRGEGRDETRGGGSVLKEGKVAKDEERGENKIAGRMAEKKESRQDRE
jgi:hypothetical protein